VAAYDVDIQLAVKNLNTIKALKKELDAVEQALERISKLDTFDPSGFRARSKARQDEKDQIKDQIRLTNDLKRAESARRADLLRGVRLERQQRMQGLQQYAGPIGPGPASPVGGRIRQMQEVEQLTKAAFAAYTQLTSVAKAHDNNVTKIELANDDVVFRQKLAQIDQAADAELNAAKTTNAEALKDFDRRLNNRITKRKNSLFGDATGKERAGAAVSAGAFPLLFGGGPGMAIGGAFGGAITGSTFGPASIALQVLGGAVDTYVAQLTSLADSLESTQGILSGLEEAGYEVSDSTKSVINSYEDAGLFADAYAIALEEISRVLGPDGAAKLAAYKEETDNLQAEIEKVTGSLKSELLPVFTGLIRVILGTKSAFDQFANSPLGKLFIQGAKQGAFNLFPGLGITEKAFQGLQAVGAPTGEPGIPESVRLATEDASAEKITSRIDADTAAREAGFIVDAQIEALQAGNNLLDDTVVITRQRIIQEEYLAKMREEGITDGERDLAEKEKTLALSRLDGQVQAAATREQEKQTRELERQGKETERLTKKKERAIERAIKGADRELERADKAFNRANDQLDKIIQKNEDKMAFEREYAELINNGSTPAAAKQAIELKKQQVELDRNFEKLKEQLVLQLEVAKAAILTAKARGASGTELDALNKDLADLLNKIDSLPGKKEDAEGAILEALAPKSDRERLQAYLVKLQEQLNDLNDPVKQITGLAETLGGAFSESFKGIVSGSMTAQQALANLFRRTADHFLDMAAQMIAAQIKMQAVNLFMNFFNPFGGLMAPGGRYAGQPGPLAPTPPPLPPIPGMARGGAVAAGRPYMVGERGPELFVPGAQGNIVPNNAMGGGASVTVNVDASGSSVEGDGDQAAQLGKAIGIAVQQELIKQKRPGGLLTR